MRTTPTVHADGHDAAETVLAAASAQLIADEITTASTGIIQSGGGTRAVMLHRAATSQPAGA